MQEGSGWRYAPRPGRRPVPSTATPPSGSLTRRISRRLPASFRQATQVRTGPPRPSDCGRAASAASPPPPLERGGFTLRPVRWLDVDPIAGQLRRQARVLAVAPDRERE